jgi:hypothetical protein
MVALKFSAHFLGRDKIAPNNVLFSSEFLECFARTETSERKNQVYPFIRLDIPGTSGLSMKIGIERVYRERLENSVLFRVSPV